MKTRLMENFARFAIDRCMRMLPRTVALHMRTTSREQHSLHEEQKGRSWERPFVFT